MAVEIQVLKNGRPVSGVKVFYKKAGAFGGTGEKWTDSQGYVSFCIDPGMASTITFRGNGINENRITTILEMDSTSSASEKLTKRSLTASFSLTLS